MPPVKTKDLFAVFGDVHGVRNIWTPPLSKSAIYQWGDEVPELREFQIRKKHPDIDERIAKAKRNIRTLKRLETRAA
jgi:hypothetical protein